MTIQFFRRFASARAGALLLGALAAVPAMATVEVRVEARPISDPIQVFVKITDQDGDPIAQLLTSADFTLTMDGVSVQLQAPDVVLPPAQNPDVRVSVVLAMDYSASVTNCCLDDMQAAVISYVDSMKDGDYAAIIKYNATNPAGASVVLPFTEIDHDVNNDALEAAVVADYPGNGTNLFDALELSINQFITPPPPTVLPAGPKAVIVIADGGDSASTATEEDVIALANANSIPLFLIGVGDFQLPGRTTLLTNLAADSGGEFIPAPSGTDIAEAYATLSALLSNEYVISIPSVITDCEVHELEVAVANQATPVTVQFTRRVCDTEPNPFTFTNQTGVAVNTGVTSNTVTITGLEVPADISTQIGTYSIGCDGTFTGTSGMISNGETVCVRHTSSAAASTTNTTTLTIGGVSGTFTSTTQAASGGGGGGGGGGGATGGLELLAGLAALFARHRRRV